MCVPKTEQIYAKDGLEAFAGTLKSLRMQQLPCALYPSCFHTVMGNAAIHHLYLDGTMVIPTVL